MKLRRYIGTGTVIALIGALSALIWVNRDRFTPLDLGSPAPAYSAVTLDGDTVALSDFAGEVVVLNVWATWCRPCVTEMPALQRLHEQYADRGVRVVAVSVDAPPGIIGAFGAPGGDVRKFTGELGLTFTILHDPAARIQRTYQVSGLPTTFVIDRTGVIRRKEMGAREWDRPVMTDPILELLED